MPIMRAMIFGLHVTAMAQAFGIAASANSASTCHMLRANVDRVTYTSATMEKFTQLNLEISYAIKRNCAMPVKAR